MLTKKQKEKLNEMVIRYRTGMICTTKAKFTTICAWGERYRAAMSIVLQRKDKR